MTGAARGIGLACAGRLVDEGASVLMIDVDSGGMGAAERLGDRATFLCCDLTASDSADRVVRAAEERLGGLDILVNNAGVAPRADFFELSPEAFDAVMALNVRAPWLLTQAAARRMIVQQTPGAVVNLSSVNALLNLPDRLAYCVSKGAVNQLTRNCAIALAPYAVRVNAVGPGTIATEMAIGGALTDSVRETVLSRTPLGRIGEAGEIASIVAFLCSDEASYVTGQIIYADGGRLGLNYLAAPTRVDQTRTGQT